MKTDVNFNLVNLPEARSHAEYKFLCSRHVLSQLLGLIYAWNTIVNGNALYDICLRRRWM